LGKGGGKIENLKNKKRISQVIKKSIETIKFHKIFMKINILEVNLGFSSSRLMHRVFRKNCIQIEH